MKNFIFVLASCLIGIGASNCSGVKMRNDTSLLFAAEANDKTVIIEGCGNQPVVGYTYCRVREGTPTEQTISLMAPPIKCKTKPCVVFTIFYPNGQPSKSVEVPDGKTKVTIPFSDLVKRDHFERDDLGFWGIRMDYRFIDTSEREFTGFAEGEIRLRVLRSSYVPLNESEADQNLVWRWSDKRFKYGFSTKGRANVSR